MYKVIIADDEPLILYKLKNIFQWEAYGFSLVADTSSPENLLELIEKESPHVVLLDINMPGMSGLEVMKKARKSGAKCKFVIISGYADFQYAQKAISYGCFEYLLKPVTRENADCLLENLKETLDEENGITKMYKITSSDNIAFNKLISFVDEHFCEKLYLNELTEKFGINMTYCCYLFNKNFGCGFTKYILKCRMDMAAELILENKFSTNKIAELCGYDYYHFNKLFKKYFGMTPKQYRNSKNV
ncbi:MAG: response regulator [Clostridia bacterium]|nr:response regulator [Clostridia bacterium]